MASQTLTYLFHAIFKDGTTYTQNQEDTPQSSPTGSAFTDIKDRLDDIQTFQLINTDGHATCSVDLTDGYFEVNGVAFEVQDPSVQLPEDAKRRLIYFRRCAMSRCGEDSWYHPIVYHIGYQTTVDGKNYQYTISVS